MQPKPDLRVPSLSRIGEYCMLIYEVCLAVSLIDDRHFTVMPKNLLLHF